MDELMDLVAAAEEQANRPLGLRMTKVVLAGMAGLAGTMLAEKGFEAFVARRAAKSDTSE